YGGFTGSIGLVLYDGSSPPPPAPRSALLPPYPSPSVRPVTTPLTLGARGPSRHDVSPPPPPAPRIALLPPYPSPSVGPVTIPFTLAAASHVELRVFDARGRAIRWLIDGDVTPGVVPSEAIWDGVDEHGHAAGPGVYIARLRVENTEATRRFVFTP